MSRRNQDLVSRVRFEVDSRMANATMQALQTHAEKLNQQVAEVNASIKALGNVPDDSPALLEYRKQLRRLNSDLKDVNTTMKDYTRGVKAAGELYRHYAMGNIEDMSIKAIRAGVNGMKKRLDNLKAGGDPGDAEEMRLIEAITTEADVVVKRFKTDYQHVVEEIARGGTVTEQTLKRTRDGLADLMQTAETEAEKNELTNYWQKVGAAIEAVAVENRRLRGEVADREEAMRIAYATDHDGSQQAIHDAEARADAARRENDELRQRLDLKQQQRRELEQEMDINSMQVRSLMDRRDELKAQEKEDRAIRNQRVDDANKELNNARRAAKTQQQAYDEQKQTVEKLRTEVQGLTDDIRKMGEVKAEPKIDTSGIDELKAKLESLKAKRDELNGVIKTQGELSDRYHAEFEELSKLPTPRDEMKKFEQAYAKFRDKMKSSLEKLPQDHFIPYNGYADTIGAADVRMMSRRSVSETDFKASVQRNLENARAYLYERAASFTDQGKSASLDDLKFNLEQMKKLQDEYKKVLKDTDWKKSLYNEEGQSKQGVQAAIDYYKALIKEYESAIKQIETLEAKYKSALETPDNSDRMTELTEKSTEATNALLAAVKEKGKVLTDITETEGKLAAAQQQSTTAQQQSAQSSEQLAQKQEQLSQKTAELNQQQDKLNGMVDETVTANQRLAKAEQEQTDARNAQAEAKKHEGEAVKKVEDELRGLTDEQLKNAQAYSHLTEEINTDTAAMQRNITTEQEATREADRLRSGSIDKMEQALARLRESNRKLDPTIDKEEWERGERAIGQITLRLEELKKQSAELRREPVLDMMTQRMDQLGTLSRDALTETKKFWQAMYDGADNDAGKLREIEDNLKRINTEEQKRDRKTLEERAGRLGINNLGRLSEQEIRQSIDAAQQLVRHYKAGSEEANRLSQNIVAAEQYLKEHGVEAMRQAQRQEQAVAEAARKRQEQDSTMRTQLYQIKDITESALKAQEQYWQRLIDDPKTAADALARYRKDLEHVHQLQEQQASVTREERAARLNGDLNNYSEAEIREAIEAGKQLVMTYKSGSDEAEALAQRIVAAETHIKQYGVEAARAAAKEAEAVRKAAAEELEKRKAGGIVTSDDAMRLSNNLTKEAIELRQRLAQVEKDEATEAREAIENALAINKQRIDTAERELDVVDKQLKQQREMADALDEAKRLQTDLPQAEDDYSNALREAIREKGVWNDLNNDVINITVRLDELKEKLANTSNLKEQQKILADIKTAEDELTTAKEKAAAQDEKVTAAREKEYEAEVRVKKIKEDVSKVLGGRDYDMERDKLDNLENKHEELTETLQREKQEHENLSQAVVSAQEREVKAAIELAQSQNVTQESIENAIAILEKQHKQTAENDEAYNKQTEAIGRLRDRLSELKGEWMSLTKAQEIASKAGTAAFAATPQEIQQATQALERRREELIKQIRAERDLGNAVDAQEKELDDLTKKLRSLKFEQDNVNMSQEKMRTLIETPANAVNIDELRAAIKRADGQLRQMQQSLGQNSDEYKRFAEQVRNAKNVMKEMEGQAKASATAWEKAFNRLKTYVVMYMGFNEVWQKITGTMGDMLELSDKMGEVMKTTGFTADQVARLSDNLKDLDTRTPMVKLMELSSIAGSIGLKTQQQVEGFTDAANQLMVALPEMGTEAARTLMKIADATGDLEKNGGDVRETLERVGSTIIALRANSAAAAGPITDFVSRVGAVGAQAGISIDQIAALGATVDALGGRVEMSATALSRMIPAIRNNSFAVANAIGMAEQDLKKMTAMEQMVAIFKALRDSVKQFDTSTDEGMNAMADKVEQMLGNSASMQEVMKTLNQQGARAGIVFGLLSQNVDKLEEQLTTATGAYEKNTALMEEYNKMNDTAAARWERLKNQLEEFFVTAGNTSWLSETIDLLRKLIVLITAEGPIGSFFRWTLVYLGLIQAKWSQAIGGAILSVYQFAAASLKSATVTAADTAAKTANAAAANAQATATGKAAAAQGLLNKTMKANLITAVLTAVVALGFRLWEYFRAANSAQEAQKRLNEAVSQATVEAEREVGHLNNVIKALDNAKMSAEGRKEVIDKFNRDYSKYIDALGIEIKTVQDLKDNYDLLTSAMRRAAFERVRDQFKAQELEPLIKEAVEQGADLQTGANSTLNAIVLNDAQKSVSQFTKAVADLTERNLKDFRSTYRKQLQALGLDAENATLSQIQTAAAPQESNRLVNQAIQQGPQSLNEYLIGKMDRGEIKDAAEAYKDIIKKEFSKGELFNAVFDENLNYVIGQRVVNGRTVGTPLTEQTGAPDGEKSSAFNEKLYEQIEKFVTAYMEVKNRNDQIDAAFRPYVGSEDIVSGNGGGSNGGGGSGTRTTNPYGQYDRVTDPYSKWNGDDLVARRKEMLVRVRALANGADVQKVLSEDAKFISEAVRKNIKTTEQAIEWYNAERLKIQEALYNKHLTPTGDWLDPKKGAGNWRKQLQTDFDNYLRILDAYYTERKAHIEKAQAEEGLSEAEAQRLTVENETVWRKHRMELQQIYLGKSADIAEEERQRIYDILAEQDEDSADMVEKQIAISINKLHLLAQKSEVEARKIETKLVKDIATDHYKQQNAVSKQMEAIEKIISEERPFDGITKNLRDNLSTMGVLFADFDKKRREAIERGEQPEDDMAERAKQMAKRLSVVLDGVPDAYRMTFDQLKEVMIKEGFGEWAKAIEGDEQLKLAMMAQIRKTYDQVQEAIRKEAAIIKKHADNLWNDALTPDGKSMKNQFEAAISQLGLQADQVKRANSLIGAGVASDRVADRLVIQQMKVQLAMERARFALMHKIGEERIRQEQAVEESLRRQGKLEEAKRKHADIENMQKSLGLAISEEQKKVDEQRVAIQNLLEESQNRLYTELRSWADLLSNSLQGVMEASHAGDAEYYNERAKLDLTGKGGPGAGTYVVIDDAGTSDATAHYEYLDERQALERQHEIEIQNAQAEAWRKLMDDLNMKMSEQITDWLNSAAQNASVDANTDATLANTEAIAGLTAAMGGKVDTSLASGLGYEPTSNEPNPTIERIGYETEQQVTQTTTTESAPSVFLDPNNVGLPWEQQAEAAELSAERQVGAIDKVKVALDDQFHKQTQGSKESSQKMTSSTQSAFAKMTAAANLYGIAYQAMSNDNLSAAQKFSMMAIQAAGQSAITALTVDFSKTTADAAMNSASVLGKLWSQLGWGAVPVYAIFTGLLGGLMGLAASKIAKSKSEIAQATGASVGAGRLATGMLTYKTGNVNELTDPASLTPGRQYNVDGADGKTYRAKYMGKGAKTHITNGPEFHLVGEAGREAIIDAKTTRLLQMDETGIWRDIQTLYNGGSISGMSTRRRRGGVRAFADGNVGEFEEMADGGGLTADGTGGMGMEQMLTALDRNSAIQEALLERLNQPIYAQNILYGPDGLPNVINKLNKEAQRHGEKYL